MTNADKIRKMDDQQLCDFLGELICDHIDPVFCCAPNTDCEHCKMLWLEEDDDSEGLTDYVCGC